VKAGLLPMELGASALRILLARSSDPRIFPRDDSLFPPQVRRGSIQRTFFWKWNFSALECGRGLSGIFFPRAIGLRSRLCEGFFWRNRFSASPRRRFFSTWWTFPCPCERIFSASSTSLPRDDENAPLPWVPLISPAPKPATLHDFSPLLSLADFSGALSAVFRRIGPLPSVKSVLGFCSAATHFPDCFRAGFP